MMTMSASVSLAAQRLSGVVGLPLVLVLCGLSLTQPLGSDQGLLVAVLVLCALQGIFLCLGLVQAVVLVGLSLLAAWLALAPVAEMGGKLPALGWAYGLQLVALALLAQLGLQRLAPYSERLPAGTVAGLFGLWLLYFWQLLVTLFAVPQVLLPTPAAIGAALWDNAGLLAGDFVQTVLKSVLVGYVLGSGLGVLSGIAIERFPFLQRGFLPLANLTSTIPLVGIAPIAVMWFGFDWPSKAAVIVLVTYFPALVSTLAGLQASGKLEQELLHSYAASPRVTLLTLRLPAALPFIFSALKVNATLALISAIVAEYFGSPTAGLGFRISAEAARMHMPIVWAAIVVASVVGSALYALLVRLERRVTFWHPSIRGQG
ncbi:ABC transporter permease [Pseudaeromonas paramecii]|uniref:ABC transmembrane type-1 domain-containing protein n=1 Tax=Pseudaeromonas paramecii TaxID=2138166 RepID=A0ABP8PV59_9GAMM